MKRGTRGAAVESDSGSESTFGYRKRIEQPYNVIEKLNMDL